ncbi:MAG: HAMP domain-containing histidine kinase [Alphaproteobacteria bacterium]|nr:HAMP domain-containing histidine kinase [Alphaproteobacteria bacterium]
MSDLVVPPGRDSLESSAAGLKNRRRVRFGLAIRVLVLVTAFVMAAAAMVYVPAIGTFRDNWLRHRLSAAYTAALVLDAAPQAMVPPELSQKLLNSVGACIIVLNKNGTKNVLAASDLPSKVDEVYDFREPAFLPSPTAITTLMSPPGRYITVLGEAPMVGESIAITMSEAPLIRDMRTYSIRLLLTTLVMSAIVAILATIAIQVMVLLPVRRLTTSISDFGANPENALPIIVPSSVSDEIAHAEEELAIMQDSLVRELNEKKHLAALGLAVAKINHDMRNMLASAQLLSDRLVNAEDPLVQRLAPKLVATLDRAIRFCQATLTYGRAVDDPPKPVRFSLHGLVTEVMEMVRLEATGEIAFINSVPADFDIWADQEQMFRVLMNLIRNAAEALGSMKIGDGQTKRIQVVSRLDDGKAIIEVADTGPGVPPGARAKLFIPFSSNRSGGSGLGLVIAKDLVKGHGGTIMLIPNGAEEIHGSRFRISLPQPASPAWP